jgi:hypothetical protein
VETLKVNTMMRIVLSVAAAAGLICLNVSPSHAQYFGDAPWCAVVNIGTSGVHWDCEYQTVEACVPNVLAGNRGFCELNPYGSSARPASVPVTHRAYRPRYRTHKHSHRH